MTADIVTSMASNNKISTGELPGLIGSVYEALAGLGQAPTAEAQSSQPNAAVSVRKSLADPDVIISMIDGKPYKMLTRHIGLHGYTPQTYRETFGLRVDYPMVAPNYALKRSELAKRIGLGRKKVAKPTTADAGDKPIATPVDAPEVPVRKKPGRPRKAAAASN